MEAFGMYLLKSMIWLTGFELIYFIFLRNERYFNLNRAFLLAGIVASVIFPFFTWHYAVLLPSQPIEDFVMPEVTDQVVYTAPVPAAPAIPFYWWIYILGIVCFMIRLIIQSIKLIFRLRKTGYEKNGSVKLVRTPEYNASFSFFSYVFVNPSISDTEAQEILNHESGHIQSRHWFDLLLVEIVRILQWFNPFAWIYAHFVRQNHEFSADEMALRRTSDPAVYRAALLNQVFGVSVFSLANSFSYSLNQKRFNMMKKRIQSPIRKFKLLLVLPIIAAVFYAFAKPEYVQAKTEMAQANLTNEVVINSESVSKGPEITTINAGKNKVKGTVTNEKGEPLEGVTVAIKGTTSGMSTDANGDFILKDVPADAELTFSYVGKKSQELKADFDHRMKVMMSNATIAIQPVNVGEDPNHYPSDASASMNLDKVPVAPKGQNQFYAIEQMPQYPGGQQALMRFLLEKVKYPAGAKAAGKEGTVLVSFLVNQRGKIKDVALIQGVDPQLDAEAIRVVSSIPDWNPGKQNGKGVEVSYAIPIQFSLKDQTANSSSPKFRISTGSLPEILILVDGKEISKEDFAQLDQSKFISVSVLKDASAVKPFGEKGKNGVILITTVDGKKDPVYSYKDVDTKPQFPGELMRYLASNLKYPVVATEGGYTGTALIRFVVTKNGETKVSTSLNHVHSSLVMEAERVISKMPKWNPGIKDGKPVDVLCTLPFRFVLKGIQNGGDKENEFTGDFSEVVVVGLPSQNTAAAGQIREDAVYTYWDVDEKPIFPGGEKEMFRFLQMNIKYPVVASEGGYTGTALVQFTISNTGQIENAAVVNDVHSSLKLEAERVMKKMPNWEPGKKSGKTVNVQCTIPFRFSLVDKSGKPLGEQTAKIPGTFQEIVVVGFGENKAVGQVKQDPVVVVGSGRMGLGNIGQDTSYLEKYIEQMPEYPGGQKEMMKFITENMKYPPDAINLGVQGVVIAQFIVTKTGKLDNIRVVRGVGPSIDKEALRILKLMPAWIPGKQGGKPVNIYYTLPLRFELGKNKGQKTPSPTK